MQDLLVYAIVLVAALYVGLRFAPAGLRNRLAARSGALMRKSGLAEEGATRLEQSLKDLGGCSNCSSCSGCRPAGEEAAAEEQAAAVKPLSLSRKSRQS